MAGARKASSKPAKSLEATLWDAADKLRGNLEASEYKHVVLGLVFLTYVRFPALLGARAGRTRSRLRERRRRSF